MLQVRILSCNICIVRDFYICMHVCILFLVGKQLLNARKLEALLTAAEQRREQESARAKKRSRSGAPISCKTEAADGEHPRSYPFFCSLSRPPSFSLSPSRPPPLSPCETYRKTHLSFFEMFIFSNMHSYRQDSFSDVWTADHETAATWPVSRDIKLTHTVF